MISQQCRFKLAGVIDKLHYSLFIAAMYLPMSVFRFVSLPESKLCLILVSLSGAFSVVLLQALFWGCPLTVFSSYLKGEECRRKGIVFRLFDRFGLFIAAPMIILTYSVPVLLSMLLL